MYVSRSERIGHVKMYMHVNFLTLIFQTLIHLSLQVIVNKKCFLVHHKINTNRELFLRSGHIIMTGEIQVPL